MIKKILFKDVSATIGTILTAFILLFMCIGPFLTDYDPLKVDMASKLLPPSSAHLLGTDEFGRDLFARLAYGAKYSIGTAVAVIAIAAVAGIIIGGLSGYIGGWVDNVIMRICDIFMSFPQMVLAMIIATALGAGLKATIIALAVSWWPNYARMVRGMVIVLRENLYVEAARAIGVHPLQIIFKIIIPQTMTMVTAQITMGIGSALIAASGFSFIGLGAQMPLPEWGAMISSSTNFIFKAWWYGLFPGLMIFISVLGFCLLGDSLQEALNPRLKEAG